MKKFLALMAGALFAFASGFVYAEYSTTDTEDSGDKVYRDDDLSRLKFDQDLSTLNQMPSEQSVEGSGAGGVTNDSDSLKYDISPGKEPVEKRPVKPEPAKPEPAEPDTNIDMPGY
jgi:hypothetical protein